ncbi:lipopolysaccharide biosynthesis protein [Halorubrum sp. C191]|uniref:lipopolysaccharide biosynthesis protein n=1 Tax=Halorubrum sp. C191 TaxID=1383842 RepID=UPI0011818B0B|nr:polysaccharide biosynthesis C-terminal domain-containing protein [Halorubrum sp. C191]
MSSRPGKTTIVYFLSQVGTTLVGGIATWYINNQLGPGPYGEYSIAVAFLFWLNIPASALGEAVKKRASEGTERGSFLTAGHLLNLGVHALLVTLILIFGDQVNILIGLEVARYFAALVAARALFDLALSSLRGYKQVGTSGGLKTFEQVLRSSFHIGALFFLGIGVGGLVLGHATAMFLATAVGLTLLDGRPERPDLSHFTGLLEYARYSWLGTLKTRAFAWTDVLMMRALSLSVVGLAAVSKPEIGIYKVAWTVASVLALVSIAIKQTLFPEFSELSVDENYERVHHFLNEGLTFTGIFAIPGLFGAIVVGDTVLTIFGAEYARGGTILVILIGSRLLAAYGGQFLNTINAIDRPDIAFRVNLVYVVANVGLNFSLITLFGWYGAAFATALASLTTVLLSAYALQDVIGSPDIPFGEIGLQTFAAVVMISVVLGFQQVLPKTLAWTLVVVAIGAVIYGGLLLGLSPRIRAKVIGLMSE